MRRLRETERDKTGEKYALPVCGYYLVFATIAALGLRVAECFLLFAHKKYSKEKLFSAASLAR
jgi:hypothetical protein